MIGEVFFLSVGGLYVLFFEIEVVGYVQILEVWIKGYGVLFFVGQGVGDLEGLFGVSQIGFNGGFSYID